MVHFAEINQAPRPYTLLQYIGRVATPTLVPRNCIRYLKTTFIMGGGGLDSKSLSGIVGLLIQHILFSKFQEKEKKLVLLGSCYGKRLLIDNFQLTHSVYFDLFYEK